MKTVLNATVFISLFCLSSGCSGSSPGKQDAVVDEQYDIAPEVASSDVETGENDGDFPGIPDAVEENESSAVDDAGETVEQDTGKDASDATEATDAVITASTLVLDPASLIFFSLPINSIRYAVSGHDKQTNTCVTIIWDYSNNGEYLGAHCGHFYPGFPYVIVKPDEPETCGIWNYGSNDPVLEKAEGCVDFKELGNTNMDMVDVELTVKGDIFTGKIIAGNRSYIIPAPVSMGIEYTTDIPEDVYVQAGNALGLPDWVVVKKEGVQLKIFDQ
ncbi:MAG: hypothetical protein FJ088_16855, partial [Deltaproteobacteria bacterium]|nr:hypothetical protein [Deltaproteobacteria bacterium]